MSRFRNRSTSVVVSVADEKDDRFGEAWETADKPASRASAKKSASSKSEK